jgi:hypothetical protein
MVITTSILMDSYHLNSHTMAASTHNATLNLPSLPHASRQAHILPGLVQHSLIYVGQMCGSGCAVKFTAAKVTVTNGASTIVTGQRDQ